MKSYYTLNDYSTQAIEVLNEDLRLIIKDTLPIFKRNKNKKILITGGTGFIGKWILFTIYEFNIRYNLNIRLDILSRNPKKFLSEFSNFKNHKKFRFLKSEVTSLNIPNKKYDYILHAATESSESLNRRNPLKMFETIINGTKNVLEYSKRNKAGKILYFSSGAVYGNQPKNMMKIPESWYGSPSLDNHNNTYAEAKRAAEIMCQIYITQYKLNISIIRIFTLIGPFLPLNTHFAIGNFINSALRNKKILINGNGKPERSYLYITDLISWIFKILDKGESGIAYNVGSEIPFSIKHIASLVTKIQKSPGYKILNRLDKGWNTGKYIPDTSFARKKFNLKQKISLKEAIIRTVKFNV